MKRRAFVLAAVASGAARAAAPGVSSSRFDANFDGMRLLDQDSRPFRPAQLAGKVALFNFVFTGCSTVCPVQTRALAEVQQSLGAAVRQNVRFVSVSLDPLADTPAALKAYAGQMGADLQNWRFVTGRPGDIERLADTLRLFKRADGVRKPDDHATALWLVNRQGQLAQRYAGNPPDAPRLREELTTYASL